MRRPLIAVLFLLLPICAIAQPISQQLTDGTTTITRPDPGDVIIELDAQPLLARTGARTTTASARVNIDALLDRLERDLAPAADRSRIATNAAPQPVLRYRYTQVFAGAAAHVSPDAIERIRALDYVRAVHPDRIVQAYLADSVKQIGAPEFWEHTGLRGAGAVVAIIDTGIDYNHPAFGGGFGPGHRVKGGRDFVNNDNDPMDDAGHGTHVAGIVAANGGGITGVAPDATLLAYKVLDANGSGQDSAILAAIDEVAKQHPDVVNMSLGRPAVPDDPVVRAIENASQAGILFCVAAGNTGRFLDIGSPGNAPSAITVGAVDKQGRLASFSTRGPVVPTGDIKPEVVAPGVNIVSARRGGGLLTASGTSMSTPHVAGVAALLRSLHPDWSVSTLRAAIIDGAHGLNAEVMAVGAGLVYAADAASRPVEPSAPTISFGVSDQSQSVWTSSKTITLTNTSGAAQSLTLNVDGARDGIEVTPSTTTFDLAPGASVPLTLDLSVDQSKVPSPEAGSLSFSGFLRFSGDGASLAIPWSFVKASRARVTWTGTGSAQVKLGTSRMLVSGATTSTNKRVDLFIGAGAVTLWVQGNGANSTTYQVIRENVDLSNADMSVGPADAPYRLQFNGTDAFGRLLSDRGDRSSREMVVSHPNFESSLLDAIAYLDSRQQVFVSPLTSPTRVYVFERAFDRDPTVIWAAQYPTLTSVSGDVTMTIPTESWKSLSAQSLLPDDLANPYQTNFATYFLRTPRGTLGSLARPNENASGIDTRVRGWLTAPVSDDSGTTIRVEIGSALAPGPTMTELTAEFRAVGNGIVGGNGRLSAPVNRSGELFVIGEGPSHPSATVTTAPDTLFASVAWGGPQGEERGYDARRTKGTVFDENGNVVAKSAEQQPTPSAPGAPAPSFQMIAPLPAPGLYTFEATTSSFEVGGVPARGTLRVRFDSSKTTDSYAPILTSLRVEDGTGKTSTVITKPANAALTFSAVDISRLGIGDIQRDRTAVYYRPHGTGDDRWVAMTATAVADDLGSGAGSFFRLPDGVLYRVALNETGLQGPVDIRINVEDGGGNSTSYTVEPAFVVASARRRAAR